MPDAPAPAVPQRDGHDRLMPPPQFVPLPTPLTSFVGREQDIDHLASLLQQPDVRLVTLTASRRRREDPVGPCCRDNDPSRFR